MIYVTHHIGEALVLADEAVVLRAGRVEATGPARYVLTPKLVTAVRNDATFENVVCGAVTDVDGEAGTAKLAPLATGTNGASDAAPTPLTVPSGNELRTGTQAIFRVASEDVLLLKGEPTAISARNVFPGRVVHVETLRRDVLVRLVAGGLEWRALVTPAAVRDLHIARDAELIVAIKTHSFERLG
jgi:molybdopterin-binding protein